MEPVGRGEASEGSLSLTVSSNLDADQSRRVGEVRGEHEHAGKGGGGGSGHLLEEEGIKIKNSRSYGNIN